MLLNKTRLIRVKTKEEIAFLEAEFKKDPLWSRKTVQICKEKLNLETAQIYKWGFDKKNIIKKWNKARIEAKKYKRKIRNYN